MDWQIIISSVTLALVIFTIIWGTGLWLRRETIKILYPNVLTELKVDNGAWIHLEYSFNIFRVRGKRNYYVSEILLELDKHLCEKLRPYFRIPESMSISLNQQDLRKLEVGKSEHFGYDDDFQAKMTVAKEKVEEFDNLVQKLWHRYKIGWKDTYGEFHWKTINQLRDIQKSFKKAM